MRELAAWELVLGGVVVVWVLWRFTRRSGGSELSPRNLEKLQAPEEQAPEEQAPRDWAGLLWPLAAVVVFVYLLIKSV